MVENLEAFYPAAGLEALESLRLQHAGEGPADTRLVIDDKTVGGAGDDRPRVSECHAALYRSGG